MHGFSFVSGEEYRKLFKRFFNESSILVDSEFRPTTEGRNRNSARAFLQGLFGKDVEKNITLKRPPQIDTLLRFYRYCKRYETTVLKKPLKEYNEFIKGPEMQETLNRVREKIGKKISFEDLNSVYESCIIEFGIYGNAPWCCLFEHEDIENFEYANDLLTYWRDSYPQRINYEQSCNLIKDLWTRLESAKEGMKQKVVGRWTHLPAINMFYTRLGLFKDEKMLFHNNFQDQLNRKWRMSRISPMSCNIAFVLLECDGKHKVAVYHNGKLVKLEGTCKNIQCDWDEIESLLKPISENCNFEKICNSHSTPVIYSSLLILLAFLMKFLLI